MKRIIYGIVLLLLLCSMLTAPAETAEPLTAAPGETVTVTFEIAGNDQNAISARIGFAYDTSVLTFVSAEAVSADVQASVPVHADGKFGLLNIQGIAPGVVGTVALRINDDAPCGDYEITPVVDSTYDRSLNLVQMEVTGAVISIDHTWGEGNVTSAPSCEEEGLMSYPCLTCDAVKSRPIAPTGHTEGTGIATKHATCLAEGEMTYYCMVCNQAVRSEVVPATDHMAGDTVITVEPTCISKGKQVTQCAYCGKTIAAAEINYSDHTWDMIGFYVEPTCTTDGFDCVSTCELCGYQAGVAVPATGHEVQWEQGYPATCIYTGMAPYAWCKKCDEIVEGGESLPIVEHHYENGVCVYCDLVWVDPNVCQHSNMVFSAAADPTCVSTGLTAGTRCGDCGEIFVVQETVPALGHDYVGTVTRESTCSEKGIMTYKCSRCTDGYTQALPLEEHTPELMAAVQPDCVNTGLTEGSSCARCGAVLTAQEEIPALGHAYTGKQTEAPTCVTEGVTTFTCERCGDSYTEAIPVVAHTKVTVDQVDPTCLKTGLTKGSHCAVCGKVLVAQVKIPALGHEYEGVTTTEPGCEAEGEMTYTCIRCDDAYTEPLAAKGHTETEIEGVEPGCESTGLTAGVSCGVCGKVITPREEIPATGHSYGEGAVETEATCTEDGIMLSVCTICGDEKRDAIPAAGHSYEDTEYVAPTCTENGYAANGAVCGVCGDVQTAAEVIPALGHDYGEGVIKTEAACTTEGLKEFTCSRCGNMTTEVIPALGHTEVKDEAVAPGETTTGLTEGSHCGACGEIIVAQQVIPAVYTIEDGVLTACAGGQSMLTIPANIGITTIGSGVLAGDIALTTLVIPEGVTSIGADAFADCANLANVTLPDSVTSIEGFDGCSETMVITSSYEAYARTWALENGYAWAHDEHTIVIDEGIEANCIEGGMTEGQHCSVCGEVLVYQEIIPATGVHTWDEGIILTEPECDAPGEKLCTCVICGVTEKMEIQAEHDWYNAILTVKPTWTEPGEMSYVCVNCGVQKTETIYLGIVGDVNEDEVVDMLDVIYALEWYCGGVIELNLANGDVTGDGETDMLDIITILDWCCGGDVEFVSYADLLVEETAPEV